jgi:hypothetical protein
MRHVYKICTGKIEGKRQLRRPSGRWQDNTEMYLTETGLKGVDWIQMAQEWGRWRVLVNTVINLEVP